MVISDNPTDTEEGTNRTEYVAEGNQFVWITVENIDNFERRAGYYYNAIQDFSKDTYKEPYTAEGYTSEEGNREIEEEREIRTSVGANGGFYIGRYEAGKDGTRLVVKKNRPVYNNVKWGNSMTELGGNGAVGLARNFVRTTYAENQTTVKSTLIYGVQWDAALKFIDSEYTGFAKNSSKQGWYSDNYNATTTGNLETNSDHTTGKDLIYSDNLNVIANKQKNIYDLAGNVWEWTMEAYYTTNRVNREGNYTNSGVSYPASYRNGNSPDFSDASIGLRVALYL